MIFKKSFGNIGMKKLLKNNTAWSAFFFALVGVRQKKTRRGWCLPSTNHMN